MRNALDPNELVILLEWDSLENARRFADVDELREAMQRAGVTDRPDVYFLEEVERLRALAFGHEVRYELRSPAFLFFLPLFTRRWAHDVELARSDYLLDAAVET